jgi:hypothetical protein
VQVEGLGGRGDLVGDGRPGWRANRVPKHGVQVRAKRSCVLEHRGGSAGALASALAKHRHVVRAKEVDEACPDDQVLVIRQILAGGLPIPSGPGVAEVEGRMSADAGGQPDSVDNLIVCWHVPASLLHAAAAQGPLDG